MKNFKHAADYLPLRKRGTKGDLKSYANTKKVETT
jgi:hypothetical protein